MAAHHATSPPPETPSTAPEKPHRAVQAPQADPTPLRRLRSRCPGRPAPAFALHHSTESPHLHHLSRPTRLTDEYEPPGRGETLLNPQEHEEEEDEENEHP